MLLREKINKNLDHEWLSLPKGPGARVQIPHMVDLGLLILLER